MKRKKILFDVIFIVLACIVLIAIIEYGIYEKYLGFALIPILISYYVGQYSARKFK